MQQQTQYTKSSSIDPDREEVFTQAEALDYCHQITGKRPSPSTWHRWRMQGVSGVQLETILISGKVLTSREAMVRFFNETAHAKSRRLSIATKEGLRKAQHMRDRRQAKAESEAEGLGI